MELKQIGGGRIMGDTLPIKRTRTSRKQVVYPELSDEQMYFVKKAVEGNNILVDALIKLIDNIFNPRIHICRNKFQIQSRG